jgi:D-xylono/L-arabinono-1,4-lactonase
MTMRPPSSVPEVVADQACSLATGPFWQPASGLLYWTDGQDGSLYSYGSAASKATKLTVGEKVIQGVPRRGGGVVLFMADGTLKVFDAAGLKAIEMPLSWNPRAQLEAVTADRQGRLLYAVRSQVTRSANLYRAGADGSVEEVLTGLGRASGLGLDPSGAILYCSDAASREIVRFLCDRETGALTGREVIFQVPESLGTPHGLAVDAKGFLWVAVWGGSCVLRLSPTGKEDRRAYFTAKLLSGLAFGGQGLRDLFVVSSGAEDRKANGPGAGALYRLLPGVRGASTPLLS